MNVRNTIALMWFVEDPVYSYQGLYEYTPEEFGNIDWNEVAERQEQEYNEWLANIKQLEGAE